MTIPSVQNERYITVLRQTEVTVPTYKSVLTNTPPTKKMMMSHIEDKGHFSLVAGSMVAQLDAYF